MTTVSPSPFPSRSAWRDARSAYIRQYMATGAPYLEDPAAPGWIRDDMPPAEWAALSVEGRAERLRRAARRVFEAEVPMPPPGDPSGGGPGGLNSIPPRLRPDAPRWASKGSWLASRKGYVEARFVPGLFRVITGKDAPRPWILRGVGATREEWEGMVPGDREARVRALGEWIFDRAFPDPDTVDPLDPDTWLAQATPPDRLPAPAPVRAEPAAQAVAVAQPVQDPAPSPGRGAVVMCGVCGEFVPVRPGRAAVPAVGGRCAHD